MTTQVPELLDLAGSRWWFVVRPDLRPHKRIIPNPLSKALCALEETSTSTHESWFQKLERQSEPDGIARFHEFIDAHSSIPESRSELAEIDQDEEFPFSLTSGCRRRYQGTWAIEGGHLFLTRLSLRHHWVLDRGDPILASWVSGSFLAIPAESVDWARYDGEQPRYRLLKLRRGRLIDECELDGPSGYRMQHHLLFSPGVLRYRRNRRMKLVALMLITACILVLWFVR